jgi:hypothetical protein
MPLRIYDDGSQETLEVSGSKFFYTCMGSGELHEIRAAKRDPRTMLVDGIAVETEILCRHFIGWENVLGRDGKPVTFDKAQLCHLSDSLRDTVIGLILHSMRAEEVAQGNSQSSSTG